MAVVVRSLKALDTQLTAIAPRRTLPTWYAGDPAHKLRPSGHNADDTPGSKPEDNDSDNIAEIRAGDYRLPLNAAFTPEQFVQWLVKKCRSGAITWIKYIIFNRRIWAASSGWVTRAYNGSNPHDKHFHVSSKPDTASENTTKDMGMRELVAPKPRPVPRPTSLPNHKLGSRELKNTSPDMRGTDIQALQRFLGLPADGIFGTGTEKRVKEYQRMRGIKADGIAGPKTLGPIVRALGIK